MISGSALADALIATLVTQSASVFNSASHTGNLTKNDFGLLDSTQSGCVFMVLPGGFSHDLFAQGNPASKQETDTLTIRAYVKDTGDPVTTINRVWALDGAIAAALDADDTLGGSALLAYLARGNGWDGNTFVQAGGVVWIPQDFSVEILNIR